MAAAADSTDRDGAMKSGSRISWPLGFPKPRLGLRRRITSPLLQLLPSTEMIKRHLSALEFVTASSSHPASQAGPSEVFDF